MEKQIEDSLQPITTSEKTYNGLDLLTWDIKIQATGPPDIVEI